MTLDDDEPESTDTDSEDMNKVKTFNTGVDPHSTERGAKSCRVSAQDGPAKPSEPMDLSNCEDGTMSRLAARRS